MPNRDICDASVESNKGGERIANNIQGGSIQHLVLFIEIVSSREPHSAAKVDDSAHFGTVPGTRRVSPQPEKPWFPNKDGFLNRIILFFQPVIIMIIMPKLCSNPTSSSTLPQIFNFKLLHDGKFRTPNSTTLGHLGDSKTLYQVPISGMGSALEFTLGFESGFELNVVKSTPAGWTPRLQKENNFR
ncbi:hypothetical protein B0H16DRAFT_1465678 [Mycena metata]|uniref:Uncharacterized protein n=1 Tax=Mycena metata TaxID=1033252 RepID=A0AAD7IC56_9AGAR|nr:hypothetical protein B0H16DRAFT_1465678 [Mycena metata]